MRTGAKAGAWARGQIDKPSEDYTRECLRFVRRAFDLPPVEPNAGLAWDHAKRRHRTSNFGAVPAFVPFFWETAGDADHVAFTIGGGLCISTDVKRTGRVDIVRLASIGPAWGATPLGWTEDLNGFVVWKGADVLNHVERARVHMRRADRELVEAIRQLSLTPETRTVARSVQADLVKLLGRLRDERQEIPRA